MSSFVHLHVHSQYSLLQGAIFIDDLLSQVKSMGMSAVAITDHANLFGALEFYEAAKKQGIKPILGCEIYVMPQGSAKIKDSKFKEHQLCHLILLVQNKTGYLNLSRLLTKAYLEGFYYKPRVDKEWLSQHSEGLIALSCCSKGEIPRRIIESNMQAAEKAALELSQIFPDRFYLELSDHGLMHEKMVNESLIHLSGKLSIPLVATNNAHYLKQEDRESHEAVLCIQSGHKLSDQDRPSYDGEEFYLKSAGEMQDLFSHVPQALENTIKIAESCHFEFDFDTYYFPKYDPPKQDQSLEDYLSEKVQEGFEERWAEKKRVCPDVGEEEKQSYQERIQIELKTILSMGFAAYFLVVSDFIVYAKSQGIAVGPGRGSAAGSLVAYCLKITDLDPIPYNLLFERFLNPERISMPDMDIDFCMNRRDEVIEYVSQKYGNVSQIITFGKMKAKAVIRDVGRCLDMPYAEVDKIAKLIPNALNIDLEKAFEEEPRLKELEESNVQVQKLMRIARSLEGLTRHASTHAAGVVISDRPLSDFLPLYKGSHNEIVTQFDMKGVEKIGLVKFDFLGLKTLTVIQDALKIIKRTQQKIIDISQIDLSDSKVYETLCKGDGLGVFQLESSGMRDLLTKLKPNCFEDIIALVALYRPGPLGSGMVDDFINRKHGKTDIVYELPQLEPILKDTYGVIVYQEQVMQIASALAGFSLGDADLLRRAMGKKKPEEMAKQREKFIEGSKKNSVPIHKAEKIFDLMAKFAEYGFNKSHSAAYALVSYQTAYLKTHYTAEYMASLLTHEMGDTDKILNYIQDLKQHGIVVKSPDINESYKYFSVLNNQEILFGLAAIKNVGEAAIESILESRKKLGSFGSFFDFIESIDLRKVNRKVLEFLIKAGVFDRFNMARSNIYSFIDAALAYASSRQQEKLIGQNSLFDFNNAESLRPKLPTNPEWETFDKLKFEKEALGLYLSSHPLEEYQDWMKSHDTLTTSQLAECSDKQEVMVCGLLNSRKEILTKRGARMAFGLLEDLEGSVEAVFFSAVYQEVFDILAMDKPMLFYGTVDVADENVKMRVNRVTLLEQVAMSKSLLKIKIPKEDLNKEKLEELKFLCSSHPGSSPVYLSILDQNKETVLRLPKQLDVSPSSSFRHQILQILGNRSDVRCEMLT